MPRRSTRPPHSQSVEVRFEGGEDIPILFANNLFVRQSDDGFLVSFAQSHGPYSLNPTLEDLKREGVPATIIARLLIPPNRMREFVTILNNMLERWETGVEESLDDNDRRNKV